MAGNGWQAAAVSSALALGEREPGGSRYAHLRSVRPLRIGRWLLERPIILAPMAGVSEAPFRSMVLRMGAGLAPTELVSSKGLQYGNARTEGYLRHDPRAEPLFSVQVYGGDPEAMGLAAEMAANRGAKIVDVNMGCPVKKVTKNGAGSALMTDPARAAAIVASMRARVGEAVAITAKIRAGWDQNSRNASEVGKALEGAGVDAVAIHPRTRTQGYTGSADWSLIRALVDAVSVPVLGNGDVFTVEDADRMAAETGCAGIMVGRGALGNPWLLQQMAEAYQGLPVQAAPTGAARTRFLHEHFRAHLEHHGDVLRGVRKFRQHLIWYSRGFRGGHLFRKRAVLLEEPVQVEDAIEEFFSREAAPDLSEPAVYDERTALG